MTSVINPYKKEWVTRIKELDGLPPKDPRIPALKQEITELEKKSKDFIDAIIKKELTNRLAEEDNEKGHKSEDRSRAKS